MAARIAFFECEARRLSAKETVEGRAGREEMRELRTSGRCEMVQRGSLLTECRRIVELVHRREALGTRVLALQAYDPIRRQSMTTFMLAERGSALILTDEPRCRTFLL